MACVSETDAVASVGRYTAHNPTVSLAPPAHSEIVYSERQPAKLRRIENR